MSLLCPSTILILQMAFAKTNVSVYIFFSPSVCKSGHTEKCQTAATKRRVCVCPRRGVRLEWRSPEEGKAKEIQYCSQLVLIITPSYWIRTGLHGDARRDSTLDSVAYQVYNSQQTGEDPTKANHCLKRSDLVFSGAASFPGCRRRGLCWPAQGCSSGEGKLQNRAEERRMCF